MNKGLLIKHELERKYKKKIANEIKLLKSLDDMRIAHSEVLNKLSKDYIVNKCINRTANGRYIIDYNLLNDLLEDKVDAMLEDEIYED